MFCNACGSEIDAEQRFCSKCGKTVAATPAPRSKVRKHIHLLAILWLVYSGFHVLSNVVLAVTRHVLVQATHWSYLPEGLHTALQPLLGALAIISVAKSVAGIAAGIGLLQRAPWARVLALVLGFLSLLSPPFGTALAIYTLWVLLSQDSNEEYQALTQKPVTA
jgi:predicted nucleic acid-binding Zn ribbon protein